MSQLLHTVQVGTSSNQFLVSVAYGTPRSIVYVELQCRPVFHFIVSCHVQVRDCVATNAERE